MTHQYMPKIFHGPAKTLAPPSYILNVQSLKIKKSPLKKSVKVVFCGKNGAQISGFSIVKNSKPLKKMFIEKKFVQLLCADKIF